MERGAQRLSRLVSVALSVIAAISAIAPGASASDRIYWGNYTGNSISFANLDGTGGGTLPTGAATVFGPMGLAIDSARGRIYWANWGLGPTGDGKTISSASLSGGRARTLLIDPAFVNGPHGLAIDPVARRLYWPNTASNTISSANLNGGRARNLRTGAATVDGPRGVAIDPRRRRIYWANWSGNRISFARLDGRGGGDLATGAATVEGPEGVALDPVGQRIFWSNFSSADKISYANLDGSGGGDLSTGAATVSDPHGIAIDPIARRIYWPNSHANDLAWASLEGGGGGALATAGAPAVEPDQPILLEAPVSRGRPVIKGRSRVGSILRCEPDHWRPDLPGSQLYRAPHRLIYRWTRGGRRGDGGRKSSLRASRPGIYRCQVTARNAAGRTVRASRPRRVVERFRGPFAR
jgi:DNA-binding beta-propeller fold protein YncE